MPMRRRNGCRIVRTGPRVRLGAHGASCHAARSGEDSMSGFAWTTLATCAALVLTIFMGIRVGGARRATKIAAPAMTGDPLLERNIRVHMNTLEWLPIFLTVMWLFALYWDDRIAAGIGAVWVIGRIIYM